MEFIKGLLRRICGVLYRIAATVMVHTLPPRLWYRAAFLSARVQAEILRPLAVVGLYPFRRDIEAWPERRKVVLARLMDSWLRYIAEFRLSFPIPVRIQSVPPLESLPTNGCGIVFCTVHIFLVNACLKAVLEASRHDLTVISGVPELGNECPVYGLNRSIPAIFADTTVLLKMKRILLRGGSVAVLVDKGIGAPLAANSLRLARIVGARLFFGAPELQANGEILLAGCEAPDLQTGGEESVQLTLEALQAQRDRILRVSSRTGTGQMSAADDWPDAARKRGARPLNKRPSRDEAAL